MPLDVRRIALRQSLRVHHFERARLHNLMLVDRRHHQWFAAHVRYFNLESAQRLAQRQRIIHAEISAFTLKQRMFLLSQLEHNIAWLHVRVLMALPLNGDALAMFTAHRHMHLNLRRLVLQFIANTAALRTFSALLQHHWTHALNFGDLALAFTARTRRTAIRRDSALNLEFFGGTAINIFQRHFQRSLNRRRFFRRRFIAAASSAAKHLLQQRRA
mmetsp:Transcript_39828/g.65225  ORF Transcript_39828/g.65225 Transcript_39828/m.65225 type:complete len:216 (-) Transcript_39828:3346-3993(-)